MTYKDIQGLDKYNGAYRSFQALEEGLEKYKAEGCKDEWFYRNTLGQFRTIISTIVEEFIKAYPDCEGIDDKDHRSIHETISNMRDMGLVDERTRKVLSTANHLGNIGDHPEMELPSFTMASRAYDELLQYMQTFIREGVPKPKKNTLSDSQTAQTQQTTQQYQPSSPRHATRRTRRRGRVVAVIVIVVVVIYFIAIRASQLRSQRVISQREAEAVSKQENEEELVEEEEGTEEEGAEEEGTEEEGAEEEGAEEEGTEEEGTEEDVHYGMGETWTVEGQWEFTVDKVTASPYYNNDGSQMILIDYHYTNLGYKSNHPSAPSSDGLYFSLSAYGTVIDADGIIASDFSAGSMDIIYPEYATVGATWAAQAQYHVYSGGNTATLTISMFDGNNEERTAIFDLSW